MTPIERGENEGVGICAGDVFPPEAPPHPPNVLAARRPHPARPPLGEAIPSTRGDKAQRPSPSIWQHKVPLAWLLIGILALGLRLVLWSQGFGLREDEAIYSYWALNLWQGDPWALQVWPDKPPLFLWLLGGVYQVAGANPQAGRLLNLVADLATLGLLGGVATRLWGARAGLVAGLAYALNPYAIAFAPTLYTDPLMVAWGMAGAWWALRGRAGVAGFCLAGAALTKQQGLLYAPLVLGLLGPRLREARTWAGLVGGAGLLALPVMAWDASRWAVAPSPWDLGVRHYGRLGLTPPGLWPSRLAGWLEWLGYLVGWPWGAGAALVGAMALGWAWPRLGRLGWGPGWVWAGWALGWLALHGVSTVQVWDRYLLPLAPVVALAWGAWAGGWREQSHRVEWVMGAALCVAALLWLPPAWASAWGQTPVGGDHGDYTGLAEAVAWLDANMPADGILYHRVLGWHYRFYFFDPDVPAGGVGSDRTRVALRWYPHAVYLADNVAKEPYRRKFLVEPDWAPLRDGPRLADRGVVRVVRLRVGRFTVYELMGRPPGFCAWCWCGERGGQRLKIEDWGMGVEAVGRGAGGGWGSEIGDQRLGNGDGAD